MQVASFRERAQAQALVERLAKQGYSDARVVEGEAHEKQTVFRVRVGHFVSRTDAERQKEKIGKEVNQQILIVTEE